MIPNTSLFITGTDTGVGKTLISALLALRLQRLGVDVGVMKPFATGCEGENFACEDAQWLREATGVTDEIDLICPARWHTPAAPLVSARHEKRLQNNVFNKCLAAYRELAQRHETVIVEGVGGWLVPLQENRDAVSTCGDALTVADFAQALQLPVVIVTRRDLGTINHSLLTQRSVTQTNAVVGWVFCDATPVEETVATQTAPALIAQMSGVPIWAQLPFRTQLRSAELRAWERQIEWHEARD